MIVQDLFESPQSCPKCGGPAFSDLILAEKKDACYYKVKASAKVWPSAYASGRLVQCRKKGADNYGKSKNEGVAEGLKGQKFIVTYNNRLSNDLYTVMVSADDEYDAKDKVRHALGMGDRITDVKSARGTEPTDREYKVFVDPRTSQKRSGIYDRQQSLAEDAALAEEFDIIESIIDRLAAHNRVAAEAIWEDLESLSDDELYVFAVTMPLTEDWQKANKQDRTDGMSRKAVNAYRRENPGSKLKTAVTTKPSKLKRGSKASKRRSSYCSRSRGQMKMHSISCAKTPDKAICKARRRWNCESVDFNLSEMDKTQTSPGRDGDIDWTKKQIHLGPQSLIKAKDIAKRGLKALDKAMKKSHADTPKKKSLAESDTGDTPIESMTAQELAAYLNVPVTQVTQDLAAAREMARDQAKDMVGEGMADDMLKLAQKISPAARLSGTPDQERERTKQAMAQRDQDRQSREQPQIEADRERLPELEAQYKEMKQLYDQLGGSGWQYADSEQNLSSSERRARAMEPQMQQLASRIQRATQAPNVTESIHSLRRLAGLGQK